MFLGHCLPVDLEVTTSQPGGKRSSAALEKATGWDRIQRDPWDERSIYLYLSCKKNRRKVGKYPVRPMDPMKIDIQLCPIVVLEW